MRENFLLAAFVNYKLTFISNLRVPEKISFACVDLFMIYYSPRELGSSDDQ